MSLNQLQTKAESSVAAVPSIDEIDHFRIITKAGESRKATPAQVRELCGVDCSKLEEQIVPGEFAYNKSQQRSQVYVRSFIATAHNDNYWTALPLTLPNSGCVIAAWGGVLAGTIWTAPISAASITRYTAGSNSYGFVHRYTFETGDSNTIPAGATVYITLKYVK